MAVGKVIGYNYEATRLTPQQSVPFKGNEPAEEVKTEEKSSGGGKILLTLAGLAAVVIAGVKTYRHFNSKAVAEAAGDVIDAAGSPVKKATGEVLAYFNNLTSRKARDARFRNHLEQIKPEKRLTDGTTRAVKEQMYSDLFSKKENLIYGKTIKGKEYILELNSQGEPIKLLTSTQNGRSLMVERPKLIGRFVQQNKIDLNAPQVSSTIPPTTVIPPVSIGEDGAMLNRFGRIV